MGSFEGSMIIFFVRNRINQMFKVTPLLLKCRKFWEYEVGNYSCGACKGSMLPCSVFCYLYFVLCMSY